MAKSNSLANQLAKKSTGYKLGVLFAIVAFLGFFYYQLVYSSLLEERDSLASRRNGLVEKQKELDGKLANKKKLAEQNEELQRIIQANQRALPTQAELPAFFDHLQRKAGDAGVNIKRWDRRAEEDVDVYIRVPVEVEVIGSFYNIMRYFALLGPGKGSKLGPAAGSDGATAPATRVDERIVSIEGLSIGDAKLEEGEVKLTAKFTASTFRQQEQPEADKGGKGKGKGKAGKGKTPAKRGGK